MHIAHATPSPPNQAASSAPDDGALSLHERQQIDRANADGRQPIVFVHGLWLLQNSWERWTSLFEDQDYVTSAPDWPGDPAGLCGVLPLPFSALRAA